MVPNIGLKTPLQSIFKPLLSPSPQSSFSFFLYSKTGPHFYCIFNLKRSMVGPITIKFLCSYGGKILPRYPDAKLRYHGGETRVLSVDRSIPFSELLVKLGELCGSSVSLRCQLPTEDLDALVSITSDEDLANLVEEYDRAASSPSSSSLKIRAFLSPPKSSKKISTPPSTSPDTASSPVGSASRYTVGHRQISPPVAFPLCHQKAAGKVEQIQLMALKRLHLVQVKVYSK